MSLFENSNADWINDRFTDTNKQAFLKQFEDFDAVTVAKSYPIPMRFLGDFDGQIKKAIQGVSAKCFDAAKASGYEVCHSNPTVEVCHLSHWADSGHPTPTELPAATITEDHPPTIQVIIPNQVKGSEEVIKTVRLILSKLYGSIFFEEHVPQRAPYLLLQEELTEIEFDLLEKVHLVHFLKLESNKLDAAYKATAERLMIRGGKAKEAGKRELFKELIEKPDKPHPQFSAIEAAFGSVLGLFQKEPLQFYHKLLGQVFKQIGQSRFILPHEQVNFEIQKQQELWSIFHALDERLQLAANSIEELHEAYHYLKSTKSDQLDYEILTSLSASLSERMKQLTKKHLVKLFLFEEATLSKKQRQKLAQFPLFLWRKKLIKEGPPAEKQIESLIKQYRGAIFQKIFEQCYRLKKVIKSTMKQGKSTLESDPRTKILATLIQIRSDGVAQLLHSIRVGKALQGVAKVDKVDKSDALHRFKEGWSYFISFALVHQYFMQVDKKKKTTKNKDFERVIEKYLTQGLEEENFFPIALILLKLYQKNNQGLSQIRDLIQSPSQTIDFFILNQQKILEGKEIETHLASFSEKLRDWQGKRYDQRITPEEIKSIHITTA